MFGFRISKTPDGRWWMVCSTAYTHQVWSGYVCKHHWRAKGTRKPWVGPGWMHMPYEVDIIVRQVPLVFDKVTVR